MYKYVEYKKYIMIKQSISKGPERDHGVPKYINS